MHDDHDLQQNRAETARALGAGVTIAILAIFGVVGIYMFHAGSFGGGASIANAPAQTATSQSAPSGSSGTVGQATK